VTPHCLASLNRFIPAHGATLSGGFALAELRVNVERIFDVVCSINTINPECYDRAIYGKRPRFSKSPDSDSFRRGRYLRLSDHDPTIPSIGPVIFLPTCRPILASVKRAYLINEKLSVTILSISVRATTPPITLNAADSHRISIFPFARRRRIIIITRRRRQKGLEPLMSY